MTTSEPIFEYRCRNCGGTTHLGPEGGRLNSYCDPECDDPAAIDVHKLVDRQRTYLGTFASITGATKPAPGAWRPQAEQQESTTEEALANGWPLIHYDSRVHDAPLQATVTPGSVTVGQAVVVRDAHTQHHAFATVTALDRGSSKATLHVHAQTESPSSTQHTHD